MKKRRGGGGWLLGRVLSTTSSAAYLISYAIFLFLASSLILDDALAQQRPAKKQSAKPPASQLAQPQRWEKEPDSFMGMKFGEVLPECPMVKPDPVFYIEYDYSKMRAENRLCFTRANTASPMMEVQNLPDIGMPITVNWPYLVNGLFEGFYFQFYNRNYDRLEALFIARYGEPTSREPVTLKNQVGLSFESTELNWRGTYVTITLAKYGSEFDKGKVDVFTRALSKSRQEKHDAERDKLKGKL
jgi:hypothetical protein